MMKVKLIGIATVLTLCAVAAMAGVGFWPWMTPAPGLQFKTRDGQLIGYLTLDINNSAAIVDTSTMVDAKTKTATLGFVVIQNADLYRRSSRRIDVEWQLGEIKQKDYTFKLEGCSVDLKTDKLKTLLPDKEANNHKEGTGE